jgi:hypothetical protein
MTLNPRHPGIFTSAGPRSGHNRMASPSTGIARTPVVGSLERINLTQPDGRVLTRQEELTRTSLTEKKGDKTLADKRPTFGRLQPAEPKEASEPASHAYHAHFSHFPRTPALREAPTASGGQRNAEKSPLRGISSLSSHFLAISREVRKASAASAGRTNAEKSPQRKPRAHRAHFLAISRDPDFLPRRTEENHVCAFP